MQQMLNVFFFKEGEVVVVVVGAGDIGIWNLDFLKICETPQSMGYYSLCFIKKDTPHLQAEMRQRIG